jgi:transcriptional regulator with XRE-family HTH domain
MFFDYTKLSKLVEECGGLGPVTDAFKQVHGASLARSTLQCWMDGTREPGINRLLSLCQVFDVPIQDFLTDEDPEPSKEWYAIVNRSKYKGPKVTKGPYPNLNAARDAVNKFRLRVGVRISDDHLRKARATIVGPFATKSRASAANANSTPLVEECWT